MHPVFWAFVHGEQKSVRLSFQIFIGQSDFEYLQFLTLKDSLLFLFAFRKWKLLNTVCLRSHELSFNHILIGRGGSQVNIKVEIQGRDKARVRATGGFVRTKKDGGRQRTKKGGGKFSVSVADDIATIIRVRGW